MLSIMTNQQVSLEIEVTISDLSKKFSEKMQSKQDIFTGFHIKELNNHDEDDKERIRKNDSLIKKWVQDLYWKILEDTRKISEEEKLTLISDDRYIFESLEKMSKEVKKISKEISESKDSLKENLDIRTAISNLNKIIDDLNEGFIEKMTDLDIESENGLFSTEDEFDIDVQKSKKELIRILEGEVIGQNARKEGKKI